LSVALQGEEAQGKSGGGQPKRLNHNTLFYPIHSALSWNLIGQVS
jgi:hypothetical protein